MIDIARVDVIARFTTLTWTLGCGYVFSGSLGSTPPLRKSPTMDAGVQTNAQPPLKHGNSPHFVP